MSNKNIVKRIERFERFERTQGATKHNSLSINNLNETYIMELIYRILEQHPLQTREYTDRNGQHQQFTAMGFVLMTKYKNSFCHFVTSLMMN